MSGQAKLNSDSQGKLSKVEWLGLESRLKMTAGGWYHTRMFRESSDAAGGPLRAATHGSGSVWIFWFVTQSFKNPN